MLVEDVGVDDGWGEAVALVALLLPGQEERNEQQGNEAGRALKNWLAGQKPLRC